MEPTTLSLVGLDDIRAASTRLDGVAIRTPLLPYPEIFERIGSERLGGEVRLKCESLQRTGAFKARGGYNFLSLLSEEERSRGVITYSSGNHAQAVAFAAGLHGVASVVVMPTTAPRIKRDGAVRLGAEIVLEGTTSLERKARAEKIAAERGLVMVPPFDHPHIIAGQGTVGLEIGEEWPEVETVVLPIGGGGLASGSAAALRRMLPNIKLIGVEPVGAASMRAAWDAGELRTLDTIDTVADGLAPVRAGELTFAHIRELMDDIVLVDDDAILEAAGLLLTGRKLVVEFSGAATLAALISGKVEVAGRRVAVVLSGGNLDPSLISRIV